LFGAGGSGGGPMNCWVTARALWWTRGAGRMWNGPGNGPPHGCGWTVPGPVSPHPSGTLDRRPPAPWSPPFDYFFGATGTVEREIGTGERRSRPCPACVLCPVGSAPIGPCWGGHGIAAGRSLLSGRWPPRLFAHRRCAGRSRTPLGQEASEVVVCPSTVRLAHCPPRLKTGQSVGCRRRSPGGLAVRRVRVKTS